MKLPVGGSTLVDSATVDARRTTATPAATIASGAATPAVTAMIPKRQVDIDPRSDVAAVETVRSTVPS